VITELHLPAPGAIATGEDPAPADIEDVSADEGASLGNTVHLHGGHTDWVFSVDVSEDGNRMITGGNDKLAVLWDSSLSGSGGGSGDSARFLFTLAGHSRAVDAVAFSARDGTELLTAGKDGTTMVWRIDPNMMAPECIAVLKLQHSVTT
jgi:WD40 repeat protein